MHDLTLCPICQKKQVTTAGFSNHIKKQHQLKDEYHSLEIFRVFFHLTRKLAVREHLITQDLEDEFVTRIFNIITDPNDNLGFYNLVKYANTFCKLLENERPLEMTDFDVMFGPYLEFKRKNAKAVNSKELCQIVFSADQWLLMYETLMKAKNPYTGHGKELSPFSKDFVGYKDLSDKEKEQKVKDATQHDKVGRNQNQIEYWTSRGMSEEEARNKVSEVQQTFSRKICIEKYGNEAGMKRFMERQYKWQDNLNSKSLEELSRINKSKQKKNDGRIFSEVELEILEGIGLSEDCHQVTLSAKDRYCYDFVSGKKVIEYNGDYWHCRPNKWAPKDMHPAMNITAQEKWKLDEKKMLAAKRMGYDVLVIWEGDYLADKEGVLQKCKDFLQS